MFPQSHWAVCYRWEVVHHIRLNVTHRNGMYAELRFNSVPVLLTEHRGCA